MNASIEYVDWGGSLCQWSEVETMADPKEGDKRRIPKSKAMVKSVRTKETDNRKGRRLKKSN